MENPYKVYVSVNVDFDVDGHMRPQSLTWEDGTVYVINKVTDVRQAAAMKAGSGGDRYTIQVNGRTSYLFFERFASIKGEIGRWFVERK